MKPSWHGLDRAFSDVVCLVGFLEAWSLAVFQRTGAQAGGGCLPHRCEVRPCASPLPTEGEIPMCLWPSRIIKTRYNSWRFCWACVHRSLKPGGKQGNSGESQRWKVKGAICPCSCWQWVGGGRLPSALSAKGLIQSWLQLLPRGIDSIQKK